MAKKRIVITGMGLASCFGTDYNVFYESLLAGKSGVKNISEYFDTENLYSKIGAPVQDFSTEGYIDKKNARRIDKSMAFAIVSGMKAVEDSKLNLESLDKERLGVIVGTGIGGMQVYTDNIKTMVEKGKHKISPFFIPYVIPNMHGALLGMELGAKGPNYSVSTACATANYAIVTAAEHIQKGDADVMIAGGVEAPINETGFSGFCAVKALCRSNEDPEGAAKPWDVNRSGFVMGEGCAIFVLESLEHALARKATILAEYKGGAFTSDAYHMTEPLPDGKEVARCMAKSLENAGLSAKEVDYVNCHATCTPVGDLCEIRALKRTFGDHLYKMTLNATKSMIGHALGGASALELVATIMAIQTGKIHPTINVKEPEEEIKGVDIARDEVRERDVRVALSNSFGFGGHNSAIVVSRYGE